MKGVNRLVRLAELYNADIDFIGNGAIIKYPVLGQGAAISSKIEEMFDSVSIKMTPSDQKLEVMVA